MQAICQALAEQLQHVHASGPSADSPESYSTPQQLLEAADAQFMSFIASLGTASEEIELARQTALTPGVAAKAGDFIKLAHAEQTAVAAREASLPVQPEQDSSQRAAIDHPLSYPLDRAARLHQFDQLMEESRLTKYRMTSGVGASGIDLGQQQAQQLALARRRLATTGHGSGLSNVQLRLPQGQTTRQGRGQGAMEEARIVQQRRGRHVQSPDPASNTRTSEASAQGAPGRAVSTPKKKTAPRRSRAKSQPAVPAPSLQQPSLTDLLMGQQPSEVPTEAPDLSGTAEMDALDQILYGGSPYPQAPHQPQQISQQAVSHAAGQAELLSHPPHGPSFLHADIAPELQQQPVASAAAPAHQPSSSQQLLTQALELPNELYADPDTDLLDLDEMHLLLQEL